jgi:hypothetical protein
MNNRSIADQYLMELAPNGLDSYLETYYHVSHYIQLHWNKCRMLTEAVKQTSEKYLIGFTQSVTVMFEIRRTDPDKADLDRFLSGMLRNVTKIANGAGCGFHVDSRTGEITYLSDPAKISHDYSDYVSADVEEFLDYMGIYPENATQIDAMLPEHLDVVDLNWKLADGTTLEHNPWHRDWTMGKRDTPFEEDDDFESNFKVRNNDTIIYIQQHSDKPNLYRFKEKDSNVVSNWIECKADPNYLTPNENGLGNVYDYIYIKNKIFSLADFKPVI